MKNKLYNLQNIFTPFAILFIFHMGVRGQTNPVPQALPYTQNFSALTHNSTTYPPGWQGWTIGTTNPAGTTSFRTDAPITDRSLVANSSASTSSGNIHNYDSKLGFLNTGSLDLSLVVAVSTIGHENIIVQYDIMTIRNPHDGANNTRINEVTLQYRVGTTGSFTSLSGIEYQNNTTTQAGSGITTPQNPVTKSITLPAECNHAEVVQLRWASRQIYGSGSRPGFAIDSIYITGTQVIPATSVNVISPADSITVAGGTLQMTAAISPVNATDHSVIWSVNNQAVGTISPEGQLTAISNGTVVVTATSVAVPSISGSKTIVVNVLPVGVPPGRSVLSLYPVPVESILYINSSVAVKRIDVFGFDGRLLISLPPNSADSVDLSALASGTYVVRVILANGTNVVRTVVKK